MKQVYTITAAIGISSIAVPASAAPTSITAVRGTLKITAEPRHGAAPLGLFRAGQTIALTTGQAASIIGCKGGWYAVEPRGFVCAHSGTSFDPAHPRAAAAREVLPEDRGYPFHYGRVDVASPRRLRFASGHAVDDPSALESWLSRADGPARDAQGAYPGMKIAWARELHHGGHTWVVTPDLHLVRKDTITAAASVLGRSASVGLFPFALPLNDTSLRDDAGLSIGTVGRTEAISLSSGRHRGGIELGWRAGLRVARTADGSWVERNQLAIFASRARPSGVGPKDKWIHVRVNAGALTAYVGDDPMFAMVISPGMHGANVKGRYRTPPGRFRISSKHLTSDMGGSLGAGAWRSRAVPWVAYYDGSFALHGAWWHDAFGRPRSHGCINLTPTDARALFDWLDPVVPNGWYAVRATRDAPGTLVLITP